MNSSLKIMSCTKHNRHDSDTIYISGMIRQPKQRALEMLQATQPKRPVSAYYRLVSSCKSWARSYAYEKDASMHTDICSGCYQLATWMVNTSATAYTHPLCSYIKTNYTYFLVVSSPDTLHQPISFTYPHFCKV